MGLQMGVRVCQARERGREEGGRTITGHDNVPQQAAAGPAVAAGRERMVPDKLVVKSSQLVCRYTRADHYRCIPGSDVAPAWQRGGCEEQERGGRGSNRDASASAPWRRGCVGHPESPVLRCMLRGVCPHQPHRLPPMRCCCPVTAQHSTQTACRCHTACPVSESCESPPITHVPCCCCCCCHTLSRVASPWRGEVDGVWCMWRFTMGASPHTRTSHRKKTQQSTSVAGLTPNRQHLWYDSRQVAQPVGHTDQADGHNVMRTAQFCP